MKHMPTAKKITIIFKGVITGFHEFILCWRKLSPAEMHISNKLTKVTESLCVLPYLEASSMSLRPGQLPAWCPFWWRRALSISMRDVTGYNWTCFAASAFRDILMDFLERAEQFDSEHGVWNSSRIWSGFGMADLFCDFSKKLSRVARTVPSNYSEKKGKFTMILETRNLKLDTRNFETRNSKLETRNSILETRNSILETRNSKLETRYSILETRNSTPRNSKVMDCHFLTLLYGNYMYVYMWWEKIPRFQQFWIRLWKLPSTSRTSLFKSRFSAHHSATMDASDSTSSQTLVSQESLECLTLRLYLNGHLRGCLVAQRR